MGENNKLPTIEGLHRAFYALVETLKLDMPSLRILGYESSRTKEPLPPLAIALHLSDIQVDRSRPTPQIGHRLFIPGELKDYQVEDEVFEDIPSEYVTSQPLPVLLTYHLDAWCHSPVEQLSLDHAILKLLPERGVLNLEIDTVEYELPIMLLGTENLDELRENFRERLYRFSVEAWIQGNIADAVSKIILNSQTEVYDVEENLLDSLNIEATII